MVVIDPNSLLGLWLAGVPVNCRGVWPVRGELSCASIPMSPQTKVVCVWGEMLTAALFRVSCVKAFLTRWVGRSSRSEPQ